MSRAALQENSGYCQRPIIFNLLINILFDRRMESLTAIFAIACLMISVVALAVLICLSIDRLTFGRPPTPEEIAEQQRRHRARLLSPNWSDLEEHFGAPIPNVLREFYAKHERLLEQNFYAVPPDRPDEAEYWFVQSFEPADLENLGDTLFLVGRDESPQVAKKRFPFASDGSGNLYFVEIGSDPSIDPPVCFIDHDGGDIERAADSFLDFVNWQRRFEVMD